MLDVHPPHHAAHGWRDFFIHIATIVVGLLIAVGLEQGVEAIHEHREARETREALRLEREDNIRRIGQEGKFWHRGTAALKNNLTLLVYLQKHAGVSEDRLPGRMAWGGSRMVFSHAAWDSAGRTGAVKLLSRGEVTDSSFFYMELQRVEDATTDADRAMTEAEEYDLTDPDPTHLSAAQLTEVIARTERAFTRQIISGETIADLSGNFADVPAAVDPNELRMLRGKQPFPATASPRP